jgi:hypothetical protein
LRKELLELFPDIFIDHPCSKSYECGLRAHGRAHAAADAWAGEAREGLSAPRCVHHAGRLREDRAVVDIEVELGEVSG